MLVDVAVIGGGVAGLRCAEILRKTRPDLSVVVLEANKRSLGGRMRTFRDHPNLAPLHIGAELVHGTKTSLARMVEEEGWASRLVFQWAHGDGGPTPHLVNGKRGYYYDGSQGRLLQHDSDDPGFQLLNESLWSIVDVDRADPRFPAGTTLAQYLDTVGVPAAMREMGDIGYANTLCSHADLLPIHETADLEKIWAPEDDEDVDIKIDASVSVVIDKLARGSRCVLGWVAASIDIPAEGAGRGSSLCTVRSADGDVVRCRAVVSAVPISAYKRRTIAFSPPLDARRMDVMDRIHFEPAMKVHLRFREAIWPLDAIGTICAHTPIPEFWFQERMPADPDARDEAAGGSGAIGAGPSGGFPPYVVTAFLCSRNVARVTDLSDGALREIILGQLNRMFGTADDPRPAHRAYHSHIAYDWGKAEHIWGGYTSPTVGVTMEDRDYIGSPVGGKLFFAGEHTARSYMAMHGAMDTGERAANQVAAAIPPKSNL